MGGGDLGRGGGRVRERDGGGNWVGDWDGDREGDGGGDGDREGDGDGHKGGDGLPEASCCCSEGQDWAEMWDTEEKAQ